MNYKLQYLIKYNIIIIIIMCTTHRNLLLTDTANYNKKILKTNNEDNINNENKICITELKITSKQG